MKQIDPPPSKGIYQDAPQWVLETPEDMSSWFQEIAQESSRGIESDLSEVEAVARNVLLEHGCQLDHTIPQQIGVDDKGRAVYRREWPCVTPLGSPPVVRDAKHVLSLARDVRTWLPRDPDMGGRYALKLGQLFHQMQVRRFEPLVAKGRNARKRDQTSGATRRQGTKEDWEPYIDAASKYRKRNPHASISGTAEHLAR